MSVKQRIVKTSIYKNEFATIYNDTITTIFRRNVEI